MRGNTIENVKCILLRSLFDASMLKQTIPHQGCPPQVLLGPFLNTLSHILLFKISHHPVKSRG